RSSGCLVITSPSHQQSAATQGAASSPTRGLTTPISISAAQRAVPPAATTVATALLNSACARSDSPKSRRRPTKSIATAVWNGSARGAAAATASTPMNAAQKTTSREGGSEIKDETSASRTRPTATNTG